MKSGKSMTELAQELARQQEVKRDFIVGAAKLNHRTDNGGSKMSVEGGIGVFEISELASKQLADKLGIPVKYFERMREQQPTLLDANVNTWLASGTERYMLRTLDGGLRALLSDRYRRLDNYDLADAVLPVLAQLPGARVESCELTLRKMYLKIVTEAVNYELAPGDVVQAGVVISNSEVGHGGVNVQPLVYRLRCKNGLISQDHALRRAHIGRIAEEDSAAYELYRDETLAADDKAFFLKVRDIVTASVSQATFEVIARKMADTRAIPIRADPQQVVEVLANRHLLVDDERSGILRHLVEGGELSAYGLVNAVTATAQEVEDYDRATELEGLGGVLIELPRTQWAALAGAEAQALA